MLVLIVTCCRRRKEKQAAAWQTFLSFFFRTVLGLLPPVSFLLVPGGYIPRLESKERECWKFLDKRLNSENDSRLHGQPSNASINNPVTAWIFLMFNSTRLSLNHMWERFFSMAHVVTDKQVHAWHQGNITVGVRGLVWLANGKYPWHSSLQVY